MISFNRDYTPRSSKATYEPAFAPEERSLMGAAFRMENDVHNALDYMNRSTFLPDDEFDFVERAKVSPLFQNNPDAFIGARSEAEWQFTEAKLQKELEDRAIIQSAGAKGIAAAMLAGVLSPTILLPVGQAATSINVMRASVSTAAWTVVGAGVQEAVLQSNQLTRTGAETAIGVSSAAVIGGMLGGAVRYLDPLGMDRVVESMVDDISQGTIYATAPPSAMDLSAAVNIEDPTNGYAFNVNVGGILRVPGSQLMAKMGPVTRMASSSVAAMRWAGNQLSTAGIMREGNLKGVPTAEGGDIESLIKGHQGNTAFAIWEQNRLFRDYYKRAKKGSAFRARFALGDSKEFGREIVRAFRAEEQGLEHSIPEVRAALAHYKEKVFMPLINQAREQGMRGFQDVSDDGAMRRAMQMVRRDLATREWDQFRQVVRENTMQVLARNAEVTGKGKLAKDLGLDEGEFAIKKFGDEEAILTKSEMEDWADEITDKVVNRLTRNFQRHGTMSMMVDMPDKAWRLYYIDPTITWSNGRKFGDFLDEDVEKIARSFTRGMAADVEMHKRFKVVNPAAREDKNNPFWSEIEAQVKKAREEAKGDAKKLDKIQKELDQFELDFNAVVGRLRHTHGMPADPSNVFHRAGRSLLNLNTVRLMGSVVPSSVADIGRPVLKYGLLNTFRHGLLPMMQDFKAFKMQAKEAQYAGAAIDVLMHGRTNALADAFDELEYGSAAERGLHYLTTNIGKIALFDYWNQGMKMFSSHVLMGKMMHDIDAVVAGKATKAQKAFLASINLSGDDIHKIHKLVHSGGGTEIRPGVWMPNGEDWADKELRRRFRASLARGVDDTIVTPGPERPTWVDATTAGRLIAQFRSYTFSSTYKVALAGMQDARVGNMAPVISGSVFSLALGMLSYYTWASSFGPGKKPYERMQKELEDALNGDTQAMGRWADEAIARSGLLGVLAEGQRFAEHVPWARDAVTFANENTARSPFINPALETLGPSISAVANAGTILASLDDPNSSTFNKGRQMLPYQNVFWLRRAFDEINTYAKQTAGVKTN